MNSLNSVAQQFYLSKFGKESIAWVTESLKSKCSNLEQKTALIEPKEKVCKQWISLGKIWAAFLLDCKDFEDAIIVAVQGFDHENKADEMPQKKVDKKLECFLGYYSLFES